MENKEERIYPEQPVMSNSSRASPREAEPSRGTRGGQPGNQNARTHGFYAKVLTPQQQAALADAAAVEGLDDEIAVLRLKIASILAHDPDNHEVLVRAMSALSRLLRTRQKVGGNDRDQLKRAIGNVLREVALPVLRPNERYIVPGLESLRDDQSASEHLP